ncbi:putative Ribonuclease VapC [Candidatus Promineifilum breve]|uniref:Ribonuclease VapC n=1 Tax=Candidatus Promineifilum breve TaxID=1806508 RepID=A0A160T1N0_9CHLR|nr:PIN domain-containing protein [Candidatus Promineifilum breve]CUS03494.2 putative Ribonuclease VapC [Candidatus Promineifilum breve]
MNEQSYLFDTGAILDVYHGRARVRPYFDRLVDDTIIAYVSPLTEAELWVGLRPNEEAAHEALLALFIPLPLTSPAGRLAGDWMQTYGGKGLGWLDALIAATAAVAGVPVLTRDKRLAAVLGTNVEFFVYEG